MAPNPRFCHLRRTPGWFLFSSSLCIHQSAVQQALIVEGTYQDDIFAFLHIDMPVIIFAGVSTKRFRPTDDQPILLQFVDRTMLLETSEWRP
jgi:hypothetical protein